VKDDDNKSITRIRKGLLRVVVLGVMVGSSVAIYKQGLVGFLGDLYDILTVVLGMGGSLCLFFLLIHFVFCLIARDRQFFLDLRSKIRKIGVFKTALISVILLAALVNFLMTQERALQGWLYSFVMAFLIRVTFFGLRGYNPKKIE
jgi:tellurite resistance protein TehA-like permease